MTYGTALLFLREHLQVWQAVYTAGVVLPKPVGVCQYFHRLLKPKKLVEIGFTRLAPRMNMARMVRLYQVPDAPASGEPSRW